MVMYCIINEVYSLLSSNTPSNAPSIMLTTGAQEVCPGRAVLYHGPPHQLSQGGEGGGEEGEHRPHRRAPVQEPCRGHVRNQQ